MNPSVPLIEPEQLAAMLGQENLAVLCASGGDRSKALTAGIPGALLADLEDDFSDPDSPLPHTVPRDVTALFEKYGVSDDSVAVIYDALGIMYAPRVWWLALAAGLNQVFVLDGGLPAWIAAGYDTEPVRIRDVACGYIAASPRDVFAVPNGTRLVVDARNTQRFLGHAPEPRPGLRGGHIPGSVNVPYESLLTSQGKFRSVGELRSLLPDAQPMLFTCGSGVTACIDALAATLVGHQDLKVYDGSWSQWGAVDSGKEVASSHG